MDISAWASVASAIGTIMAAGVAAYSARLAWKHVNLQFAPKLAIRSDQFQIRTTNSLLDDFFWAEPTQEVRYRNGGSVDYRLKVLNMGIAPAFDVRIYTKIDHQRVYQDVMGKLRPYFSDLEILYNDFGCQVHLAGEVIGGFRLPEDAFGMIDFVSGNNADEREQHCLIDPSLSFFAVCYAHYLRLAHQHDENARKVQTIPVTFRLEYRDSTASRHVEICPMELSIRGGRYRQDGSDGISFIGLSEVAN